MPPSQKHGLGSSKAKTPQQRIRTNFGIGLWYLNDMPESLFLPALLLLGFITLLAMLGWWRSAHRISRRNRARQRTASRGEVHAERILRRNGYRVIDRQLTSRWSMRIDGRPVDVHSRADLLVMKGGHSYIAEVKTGSEAPDPTRPATRRQLLEYLHAFPVKGVLLVDMVAHEIHEVQFGFKT